MSNTWSILDWKRPLHRWWLLPLRWHLNMHHQVCHPLRRRLRWRRLPNAFLTLLPQCLSSFSRVVLPIPLAFTPPRILLALSLPVSLLWHLLPGSLGPLPFTTASMTPSLYSIPNSSVVSSSTLSHFVFLVLSPHELSLVLQPVHSCQDQAAILGSSLRLTFTETSEKVLTCLRALIKLLSFPRSQHSSTHHEESQEATTRPEGTPPRRLSVHVELDRISSREATRWPDTSQTSSSSNSSSEEERKYKSHVRLVLKRGNMMSPHHQPLPAFSCSHFPFHQIQCSCSSFSIRNCCYLRLRQSSGVLRPT